MYIKKEDGRQRPLGVAALEDKLVPSGTVGVLLGNGNGTFQPVVTYSGVSEPVTVAVADVNGDGVPDVLVAGANSGVGVLLGNSPQCWQVGRWRFSDRAWNLSRPASVRVSRDLQRSRLIDPDQARRG